jgi:amino acid adenylation domain-containing protein
MSASEYLPIDHGGPIERSFEPISNADLTSSVTARFDSIALRFSDRLAVRDHAAALTYTELRTLVERIAVATQAAVATRPGPVAILLQREARFPAAMLGVLTAGRAYLALDADHPVEHNRRLTTEAGVCAVISAGDLAATARRLLPCDIVVDLDVLPAAAAAKRNVPCGAGDLACIHYTSGSTGTPRGVALSHGNILERIATFVATAHISDDDRLLLVMSPSVGWARLPIYGALLTGASLHILRSDQVQPAILAREIRARGITVYDSVPTLVRHLAEALEPGERLDSIRFARLGGERVEWSDVDACRRSFSGNVFISVCLTSTESGGCCGWFVDDAVRATSAAPPVGRPLPGRRLTIVDDKGVPVTGGEIGEILVASQSVALGHWQGRELKVAPFAKDPSDPSTCVFRTGDCGRWRPDGLIEFVGRKDQEIKLRGHRINPAEIESTLRSRAGVSDAAVLVRKNEANVPRSLVAYVEVRPGVRDLTPADLTVMLARQLPYYMVPSTIVLVDELPRLAGLKIDRRQLARMDLSRMDRMLDPIEDPLVHEVAEIFRLVLGVGGATPDDNVASLGGDSLQAVRVAVELESRFGVVISPHLFEANQTIGALADWIASQKAQRSSRAGRP